MLTPYAIPEAKICQLSEHHRDNLASTIELGGDSGAGPRQADTVVEPLRRPPNAMCHDSRREIESSGVRAAVTTITVAAPACRRHAAAVATVVPVVTTSSTSRTLLPALTTERLAAKARRRLPWRLRRLNRLCGGVGRRRRNARTTGKPNSAASDLAIAAA